jgi:DNA-binding TFAR19-related protein (PDSD5 family)
MMDQIRQRKIDQMRTELYQRQQAEEQFVYIEKTVTSKMTPEALLRYGNVKIAHPELAMQLVLVVAQAVQKGVGLITDDMLVSVLSRMTQKREIKITRK